MLGSKQLLLKPCQNRLNLSCRTLRLNAISLLQKIQSVIESVQAELVISEKMVSVLLCLIMLVVSFLDTSLRDLGNKNNTMQQRIATINSYHVTKVNKLRSCMQHTYHMHS